MSHFTVLVILPENFELPEKNPRACETPKEIPDLGLAGFFEAHAIHDQEAPPTHTRINDYINTILAPYDENMEVEEYDQECYCVQHRLLEHKSKLKTRMVHMLHLPDIKELREQFWALDEEDRSDELWQDMTKEYTVLNDRINSRQYRKSLSAPDPECSECHGTGISHSTYNPQSKWDCWSIGGRWDGAILGPDVEEARQTRGGFNFSNDNHHWENNTAKLRDLIFGDELIFTPFALVTPDGQWHQRGEMGWWAVISNEKPEEDWFTIVRKVYVEYSKHFGVVVDCHI